MKGVLIFSGLSVLAFVMSEVLAAAPPCKGANKNDPGCGEEVEPSTTAVTAVVDSVTVDWVNQALIVRGSGFTGSTGFLLGGNPTPLATENVTDTELSIPFSADIAAEIGVAGNYNLVADGTVQLSVYVESQVVDPAATGCPCAEEWANQLGDLYGETERTADCLEIEGSGENDPADISGTILSSTPESYPQYPIGASFYPSDPDASVCRLVQVGADATTIDLVHLRINEIQQADCASEIKYNVCASVTPVP
jgi:hypothetical protein